MWNDEPTAGELERYFIEAPAAAHPVPRFARARVVCQVENSLQPRYTRPSK
jgi:hypothetical protein